MLQRVSSALALLVLLSGCAREDGGSGNGEPGASGARPAQMDALYADADGDLVADPPRDATQWADPQTLTFAYTQTEDPTRFQGVWKEFCDHLAQATGRKVEFLPVASEAAQLEAMRDGRLHVTGFNTGAVPTAVNLCGFVPFCMMADQRGNYGYEMEIIVPVDSPIRSARDLRGRKLAFTQPTSNSGYKAPTVLLRSQFGLQVEKDYTPVFSGSHESSILGVANGTYEAAAIANEVLRRTAGHGSIDPVKIRSVYKSRTFPAMAFGHAHNLHPELVKQIRRAFFGFQWAGTGLETEFAPANLMQFIPITYKGHWAIIREIDKALGVRYELAPTQVR